MRLIFWCAAASSSPWRNRSKGGAVGMVGGDGGDVEMVGVVGGGLVGVVPEVVG